MNVFKPIFLLIELRNLMKTEGPIYEAFLHHASFLKKNFKSTVITS